MRRRFALFLAMAGLLGLLLASCSLPGVSIEERTYRLVSYLNAVNRGDIYQNFHPDAANYLAIHSSTYFDTPFPPVGADPTQYSIVPGTLNTANESAVTAQLYGPVAFFGPLIITCAMEKFGNDWQIRVLQLQGYGTVVQ